MSNEDYSELQHSDQPWCCKRCVNEALPFADVPADDSIFSVPSVPSTASVDNPSPPQVSPSLRGPPSILYTNCRSIVPKIDELRALVSTHHPHIICLCETWLDDSITDSELFIPTFHIVRRDRNRHGGGIAIFIHDSIPFKILLSHHSSELLFLELSLNNCNLICVLTYRPPSADSSVLAHLEDSLDSLPQVSSRPLLLLGDFNINENY